MKFYFLGILSGIIISFIFIKLRQYQFKIVVDKKKPQKTNSITKILKKESIPTFETKKDRVKYFLEQIKNGVTYTGILSPVVLNNLKVIANTPNWESQLDEETLNNLDAIFVKVSKDRTHNNKIKVGESSGFDAPEIWEGTMEEYEIAKEQGIIKENTIVYIYEDENNYRGSYIGINDDGSIEEYMN